MRLKKPLQHLPGPVNALPESPCWQDGTLFWIDHGSQVLHRFEWRARQYSGTTLAVAGNLRFVKPLGNDDLLIGSACGLYSLNRAGTLGPVCDDLPLYASVCINDGAVGPDNEIVIAISDRTEAQPLGGFYQLKASRWDQLLGDISVANGPAFGHDGRVFFSDTFGRRIVSTRLLSSAAASAVVTANGSTNVIGLSDADGYPDGLFTCSGLLLAGLWGGSQVAVYDEHGNWLTGIEVPLCNVTCPLIFTCHAHQFLAVTACAEADDERNGLYVGEID